MTRFLSFLIFAVSVLGAQTEAKTVYVGVAGAGGGQGLMGHVFLVTSEAPGELLGATFYQYAIRIPTDFHFDMTKIGELGSFPFVIDSGPAWKFIRSYTDDDRAVLLFQLKLTDDQAETIVAEVEADRAARAANPKMDYSVDSNNCATRVFDLINSAVSAEAQLKYKSPRQALYGFDFFHAPQIAMAVPLSAAPQLEKNPLVASTLRFRQRSLVDLQITVTAFEQLNPLFEACGTSHALRDLLAEAYGNSQVRHSAKYLNLFHGSLAACASSRGMTAVYNSHLDFLRFDTDDQTFLKLSAGYDL